MFDDVLRQSGEDLLDDDACLLGRRLVQSQRRVHPPAVVVWIVPERDAVHFAGAGIELVEARKIANGESHIVAEIFDRMRE